MRWMDGTPTPWTWVLTNSKRWWRIEESGVQQSMGLQAVSMTEQLSFTFSPRLYLLCFIVLPVFIRILFRNGDKSVAIDEDLPNESKHRLFILYLLRRGRQPPSLGLADTQRQAGGWGNFHRMSSGWPWSRLWAWGGGGGLTLDGGVSYVID